MPGVWTFRGFKSAKGERLIRDKYKNASPEWKAGFSVTMKFLDERQESEWGKPNQKPRFKLLSNELSGYGEIRFFADNVQQRPIGKFTGRREFTILYFAVEVGNKLSPKPKILRSILDERMGLISTNTEKYTHEWKV